MSIFCNIINKLIRAKSCADCRFYYERNILADGKVVETENGTCVIFKDYIHKNGWCSSGIRR